MLSTAVAHVTRGVVGAAALFSWPCGAQFEPSVPRDTLPSRVQVVAINAAIGAVAGALRAAVTGQDVRKPLMYGAIGGAVHGAGKALSSGGGASRAYAGIVVSSLGTSLTSNVARGVSPTEEFFLPLGVARLRVFPRDARHVRLSVDLLSTGVLVHNLLDDRLGFNWYLTARSGVPTFRTRGYDIVSNGDFIGGVAIAGVVTVSEFSADTLRLASHERVHVQQYLFAQEVVGRAEEDWLRRRLGARASWWPSWLDFGLGGATGYLAIAATGGNGGFVLRNVEREAYALR